MGYLPKLPFDLVNRTFLRLMRLMPVRTARRFLYQLYRNPEIVDRWMYSIRPVHFYEPLPDVATLSSAALERRRLSSAVPWNVDEQLSLVKDLARFRDEIAALASGRFDFTNAFFSGLDAAVYYALMRHLRPARVMEIGSGYSTRVLSLALEENRKEGGGASIICIEPFPEARLLEAGIEFELVRERVETLDLRIFDQLGPGDVLFVDSTHTVKTGGDVTRIVLEILPRLAAGVWIHFHDVWFPFDYPSEWVLEERRAWAEQYLLEAFLAYNACFTVMLACNLLANDHPEETNQLWSPADDWADRKHRASGFWIQKVSP